VIETFRHKGLKKFFTKDDSSKLPSQQEARIRHILTRLNAAQDVQDMNYGGAGFHQLSGDLKNFYSVKVTGNYRIIFRFSEGNAYDVDYLDYH
jgi:proteic killer suppression protein